MILDRIDLAGFGRLHASVHEFAPDLNIVLGPNEAGKSTLLRAIQTLLYGQFTDSNKWAGNETKERYRPWGGGPYGGSLYLTLANGERYCIERRLDPEQTRIYREPGASDATRNYQTGRRGWVDFANQHLGLSPAVFRASACIHQDSLVLEKGDIGILQGRLGQLADSGGAEKSAIEALAILDEWMKKEINPTAQRADSSPLKKTRKEVADLESELRASRTALEGLAGLAAEERQLADRVADLGRQIEHVGRLIAGGELWEIESKLAELDRLDRQIEDAQRALADRADVTAYDEIRLNRAEQALNGLEYRDRERAKARATVDAEGAECDRIDQRHATVCAALEALPEISASDLDAASSAIHGWEAREHAADAASEELARREQECIAHLATKDPRLAPLARTDSSILAAAVDRAMAGREQCRQAARRADADPIDQRRSAELDNLDAWLGDLTARQLAALQDAASQVRAAEAQLPSAGTGVAIVLVALFIGLAAGYLVAALSGAVAGGLTLATLTYAAAAYPASRRRAAAIQDLQKDQAQLARQLAALGVDSVDSLQGYWNRRSELREEIGEARRHQENLVTARQDYARAQEELDARFGIRDVDQARALLKLREDWEADRARLAGALIDSSRSREAASAALATQRHTATQALRRIGITALDLTTAQRAFQAQRDQQQERLRLGQERSALELKRERFQANRRVLAAAEADCTLAEAAAGDAFAALGINPPPAERRARLACIQSRRKERREAEKSLAIAQASRQALLGSEDPAALEARRTERQAVAIVAEPTDHWTLDELRAHHQQLAQDREQAASHHTQLSAIWSERRRGLAEPAEIEERLAEAGQRLAQLERRSRVLGDARDAIKQAAEGHRRAFAPRLGASVGDWLGQATAGRYRSAEVSPENLAVRLHSAERGGLVTLDEVSGGTRDAVMLLLRASVVDLLSSTGESIPLFLDDPLVQVDPTRTQNLLAILADLASRRQIFYFTQDPRIAEWAATRAGRVTELMG